MQGANTHQTKKGTIREVCALRQRSAVRLEIDNEKENPGALLRDKCAGV
jgi:hypothetical protein